MGNIDLGTLSQQEAAQLLQECRDIASDWDTYLQFCKKRKSLLNHYFPTEGMN